MKAMLIALAEMARIHAAIEQGLKDRREGRVRPWKEIKREILGVSDDNS